MLRNPSRIVLGSILILAGLCRPLALCEGQKNPARVDHDFYALALTSVLESESQLMKLPDVSQRVKLLIYAAKMLPASHRDDAMHFLDLALGELKQWASQEKISWAQRNAVATWRSEVLSAYAVISSEKALTLRKELETSVSSDGNSAGTSRNKRYDWFVYFSGQRTMADQAAKVALSLLSTDPDKTSELVIESLQAGVVSGVLFEIVRKLQETGNRTLLHQLWLAMGQALMSNTTLDPLSLNYTAILLRSDDEMSPAARNALVSFSMRSLEAWTRLVLEPGANSWVDANYISYGFTVFSINVRPTIVQYSPKQLLRFDWLLEQIGPSVPQATKTKLQAFQPEAFSDPSDRLTDILKDPAPESRDLRLVRLVSDLIRRLPEDFEKSSELVSNAISRFSDAELKSAFTDLLRTARADVLVKQNKLTEAQQAADSLSSAEMRAWALLALSVAAAKSDKVLSFELIGHALRVLDSASPSPHKVELALSIAGMLAKADRERAFETLSAASKYANSSPAKAKATKQPVAFGLEAKIGNAQTRLGVVPESLSELKIDPSLATLATTDWFRANQLVQEIHEPTLRLHLKLLFAEAILIQGAKPKETQKAVNKN